MEEKKYAKPLTRKVWGGSISDENLEIKTTKETYNARWEDITHITMAQVIERFDANTLTEDTPTKATLKMMPVLGDYMKTRAKKVVERANFFVSLLFVKGVPHPFRFDNISTNYRELLGDEAGYSGHVNYLKCMKTIAERAKNAEIDESAKRFLEKGKKWFDTYENVTSFIAYAWCWKDRGAKGKADCFETIDEKDWESF